MLVVDQVVPGGPADGHIEPGDVIMRVQGELVTTFIPVEAVLDSNVGSEVELQIERGGKAITTTLSVRDLHSISPSCFLEVSGAVFHPLSYQQAKNHSLPVGGNVMQQDNIWEKLNICCKRI